MSFDDINDAALLFVISNYLKESNFREKKHFVEFNFVVLGVNREIKSCEIFQNLLTAKLNSVKLFFLSLIYCCIVLLIVFQYVTESY